MSSVPPMKSQVSAGLIRLLIEQMLDSVGKIGPNDHIKWPWKDNEDIPIEIIPGKEGKVIKHK